MGELLIKPYEISVWEDKLTQDGFVENKLAVIGSDTMTGPNKVYEPVFNKKANGEKTLSFSLKYKYFDPYSENEDIINPFAALLINERKVKLKYGTDEDGNPQWYEFVVKDRSESSEEFTWTYTCTDAFVLELSKNGYNIEFNTDLNNNQGTARELAKKTLEDTDWRLGGANVGKQLVEEPVYKATLLSTTDVEIINASDDGTAIPSAGSQIYLFYSYVKNQNGKFIQFIIRDENKQYTIDDKNVIIDTNFRITTELEYKSDGFYLGNNRIISISEVETKYHVYRLAYGQLTTYDPVMERTVDRFRMGDREVYRYTDYTYTTSNVVTNFIVNGENFNSLEDGTLQGWNPYVDSTDTVKKLELVTKPELGTNKELADIAKLSQIEGFLKVHFNGPLTANWENTVYNKGFESNASFIESVSQGEKFVFRWRAGVRNPEQSTDEYILSIDTEIVENKFYYERSGEGTEQSPYVYEKVIEIEPGSNPSQQGWYEKNLDDIDCLVPCQTMGLLVAKYTQDDPTRYGHYYKHIDPNNIILQFEGTPTKLNNTIKGGYIREKTDVETDTTIYSYVIDGVVQTPSTKYIYINSTDDKSYFWDGEQSEFIEVTENNYLSYYYLVTEANKAVPNTVLTDPTEKIGIFIYTTDTAGDYYIQDIQLTKFVEDGEGQPVLLGNIPTATSTPTEYYYLKPVNGTAAEDVETYTSIAALQEEIGSTEPVNPVYNENSEKTLSISVSQSNCFDILQTIAETFECWIDLVVEHDARGAIAVDEEGPRKFVYLKEYAGKDNYAGFKYGINLQSIERTINSEEIVTKLIVDQSQSDYVDEGYISIASAPSNPSGESYILNFDYYYNQGLLDREQGEIDRTEFADAVSEINMQIQEKDKQRRNLELSFTALESKRNVYTELIQTAQDTKSEALADFETLTGQTYEDYRAEHTSLEENKQLTEEDTILETLGNLYTSSAVINNYSGLLTNIESEYWDIRTQLRGYENYKVKVWVDRDELDERHVFVELNDYLPDFSFQLGESTYESTVSVRYFDIITDETSMTFTAPQDYTVTPASYEINDSKVAKFSITTTNSTPGIDDEIDELIEQKKELIKDFNNKYRRFIQEGTWNSTDYIDSELYYLDALQVSNTSAQPTVSYSINVAEISQLEGFDVYLFDAGDKSYVEDTEFFGWSNKEGILTPAREEVIVSEVEWHLDEPDQNVITVQNYKTRFEDFFQRISAAVQTVQYNEATYAKISTLLDADGTLNQNVLLESLQQVAGKNYNLTSDGSVFIDGDRITIQNLNNTQNRVIINSEGIRISNDGGATWKTAIDGRGINIGTVYTGKLNTDQVVIGSEDNPSFRWDKSGISAYKTEDGEAYDLQTFVRYDQYGLYGIKNNGTFKAQSLEDVKDNAHFAVTWDGFFIKNSYPQGGRVEITSDNDFRITKENNNQIDEKIKIGALEWKQANWHEGDPIYTDPETVPTAIKELGPSLYGIRIKNNIGDVVMKTGDDGNLSITGTIYANAGNFDGLVTVGKDENNVSKPYIEIDGRNSNDATIRSSRYVQEGAGYGWMINADGDAIFNNITARGAIKTAVFEYSEIQAVGGLFIFRPSSTIRNAARVGETNDITITVEKPYLFKVGDWCKVSNYTNSMNEPSAESIISNNGLTHVYKIKSIDSNNSRILVLENAYAALTSGNTKVIDNITDLIGGALVNMGDKANGNGEVGNNNYGIGINSSDNVVDLPRRSISLFETVVDETENPKVSYNYRGILGTLPELPVTDVVDSIYNDRMAGTQGIYTDNMYIGDNQQYIAFYEDTNGKQLKIQANQIMFETTDPLKPWKDVSDISAIQVSVHSTMGTLIVNGQGIGALYVRVSKDGVALDPISDEIEAGIELPSGEEGQQFILLNSTNQTATLYQYNNSEWEVVSRTPQCTYSWIYRNSHGQVITTNTPATTGQIIYIDGSLINKQITADVQVTVNDAS